MDLQSWPDAEGKLIEVLLRYYYVSIEEEGSMNGLIKWVLGILALGAAARNIQKKL